MPHIAQLVVARTGATMWRLRRQIFGGLFIAVALCLFYFQFAANESITSVRHQESPLKRDLNSLGQVDFGAGGGASEDGSFQNRQASARVKFVAKSQDQFDEQQRILSKHKAVYVDDARVDDTPQIGDNVDYSEGRNNRLELEAAQQRQQAVQRAMDQLKENPPPVMQAIQQFTGPPAAVMLPVDDSFGSPWGGNYKYNPYGEPVYGKTDRPNYIPKERVVHLDLKGAPPLMSILKTLIPWLAAHGATSILFEYEDTFPYYGALAQVATVNHYTPSQISELVSLCEKNKLEIIPLVQTLGHLEFILKQQRYSNLREVPELPQALCPSRNESLQMIYEMIDQVMSLHPKSRYLHIGCDEVFQMGECDLCRQKAKDNLFLQHVATVAKHTRSKYGVGVLIWDDMLRHVSNAAMNDYHLGELVEPMVWVYAEDIYRFVQPSTWSKYSQVFSHAWAASAFKGAFGEQLTVPNVRRHLDNHMNWLDVMATESPKFSGGFRGLVLTGWQRYDHFAVLCELLPASMPSLAINLIAVSHGFFNSSLQNEIYSALNCGQSPKYQTWINLDSDPYLWDKFSWCFFPGKQVFTLMSRLDNTRRDVEAYIDRVTKSRAWITDYNRRHNFSSPMRIDEDLEELPGRLHSMVSLVKAAREALVDWFDEWTIGEWVEQHLWPLLNRLETIQKESERMKRVRYWPARPLPLLNQLSQYGISEPTSNGVVSERHDINQARYSNRQPT